MFNKIKKNYILLISTFLILYFFFNLLDGERGLFSFYKKKNLLTTLKENENTIKKNINNIEYKILLLTDNLDLDYIESLIREKFFFGKRGEKVYIIEKNEN